MAKIQIRPMHDHLLTPPRNSEPELSAPANIPNARTSNERTSERTSNVRIAPPAQASLFRKTVPGSLMSKKIPVDLPQLQVFFSAKGGSGSSLLAATYAAAAAVSADKRVLLIDMDLAAGGIEAYTGIEPARSIYHLKPVMNELHETHIRSVVHTQQQTLVDLLASPADPQLADNFEPWEITSLLQLVKQMYDLIIVDSGSGLTPLNVPPFMAADAIHYVMLPDSPSLRRYKLAESWLQRQGIPLHKMDVLLNRTGKANEIQLRDLRKLPTLNIAGTIRSDFAGIQSDINLGQPILRHYYARRQPLILKDIVAYIKSQTGQGMF